MKKDTKPFEGCLFWHTQGFTIEDGIQQNKSATLHLKINKMFSADLNAEISKENISNARDLIISELVKEIEIAFKDYQLAVSKLK